MPHVVKIVDSIASSPTTRLDLSDDTIWKCTSFEAPPPRLRRAVSANAMRDGIHVSSSTYDARTLKLRLMLFASTMDLAATEVQKLARELDRTDNYLMLQYTGATKPVFFKLFRSDFTSLSDIRGQASAFELEAELLAEPFALGLRETVNVGMVDSDPAGGSNGCFADVTGVIGDVAAPCVIRAGRQIIAELTAIGAAIIGVRQHGTPSDLAFFKQAESATLGVDTTNPGGGPDAAMSGTGTNNFVRTSFTTASMQTRLTWVPNDVQVSSAAGRAIRGTYRLVAAVRRSDSTSDINVRAYQGSTAVGTTSVTVTKNTNRQLLDLGLVSFGTFARTGADSSTDNGVDIAGMSQSINVKAERTSGAGTLDWDVLFLVPADEALLMWSGLTTTTSFILSCETIADGIQEAVRLDGSNVELNTPAAGVAGGFPLLVPNQTNRFVILKAAAFTNASKTYYSTSGVNQNYFKFEYNPRYLFIRPSAT